MKVQSIYNSKILKQGLKFAAENGALFAASASLAFSTARPLIILATPNTDKENIQYASTKAISSSIIGYLMMLCASLPVAKAVKNIDKNPSEYLKQSTIKTLQASEKSLDASKRYSFATQLFKLGLGFIIAAPKSILTCALIPPIMTKLFNKKQDDKHKINKDTAFTGNIINGKLPKLLGKIMDTKTIQNMAKKYSDTRFEQHIISLTDIFTTGTFISQTAHSKKIKENRKKALIYNAAISTGLSVAGMYAIDSLTKKPTEKFIEKFKQANKNSPQLNTYLEGIRVAKPVMILGAMYYIFIPLLSTFFADKFAKNNK
jgi:hypothetical protein